MPRQPLELLPVVHAQHGDLVGPDGEPLGEDLREVARRFRREHGALYVVDLDGLARNRPDMKLIQRLGGSAPVWADAGSRYATDVMDLMVAGAEQVTLRYETLSGPDVLEETVRVTEHVALGLEFRDGNLVDNPRWPQALPELRKLAQRFRIPLVLVDLDRAGTAQGIERSVAWHARNYAPGAYYAGGVATRRDLDVLQDLGYRGALVSTALIEGADLEGEEWAGPPSLAREIEDEEGSS